MDRVLPNTLVPLVVSLFLTWNVGAQDIHFAQFYNAPQLLNPALTGIFNGDARFMGHYRRQWANIPADYLTFSGTYDAKLYPKKAEGNDFWGFGVSFNYDNAGYSSLTWAGLQLGASYSKELAKNTFLTGGVQLGLANRSYKSEELTFDNQWNGDLFDPSLPTGENFDNTGDLFADFSVGGNLRMQKDDRRSKVDLGVALYHLNRPRQDFFDAAKVKLPNRFAIYGIGAIKLGGALDFLARATVQFQTTYREYLPGAAFKLYLDQSRGKELAIQAGANLRFNKITDAIIPTVELHYKTLSAGVSYDINISDFEIATDQKGGPEIWVSYRIEKVKPLGVFKTCPIF
ncbi:MAG: PorP/SprF family type IX secretion system membrane protein [Saprospiraceae bacterium]|nr:PorP/SprF family type IX secretion system membrane protein [Saprospiraceae bacterium]